MVSGRGSEVAAILVSAAIATAQSLPRFHAFTVEDTGVDWTMAAALGMNSRGSFTAAYFAGHGSGYFVRYADGTTRAFANLQVHDNTGPQLDDFDRVLTARDVQIAPNVWVGHSFLEDPNGSRVQLQPYSLSRWAEVPTLYQATAVMGKTGHIWPGQGFHYDAAGNQVLPFSPFQPWTHLYFCGSAAAIRFLPIQGLPPGAVPSVRSLRANSHGEWGWFIDVPSGAGRALRLYRVASDGVFVPASPLLPPTAISGTSNWQFNDRREFHCVLNYAEWVVLQTDGSWRPLGHTRFCNILNEDLAGVAATPSPDPFQQYRYTQVLATGAFAMVEALLDDQGAHRLSGGVPGQGLHSGYINDAGQLLVQGWNQTGDRRWLLLHPRSTPSLAIDIPRSHRNVGGRHDLVPEPNGQIGVSIVGGEPGQPAALFVRLGGQFAYIDGTLGVFDAGQTHAFTLNLPPYLRGLEFDLVAGALDTTFGILQSLDLHATVQ